MSEPDTRQKGTAAAPGERRSAVFIVFLVVFIDLLGFGIVMPLLPLYASELLEPLYPGEGNRFVRGALLAVLMASFSAMQFVFAPIWGRISDRVGRRPILLVGLVGSAVFYALFGVASELGAGREGLALALLIGARVGAGIAGATIATAQAVIADSTLPEHRARGMALIGAAFGIGFTFGPLLGFLSLFLTWDGAPGFAAALLSLIALVLAVVLLPETLRPGVEAGRRHWLQWRSTLNVLRTPTVGIIVLTFFLATTAFGSLESTLALMNQVLLNPGIATEDLLRQLTREELRTTHRQNFLIFAFIGLVLMLVQGLVYRRLVGRVGEVRFLRLGVLLMVCGLAGVIATVLGVSGGHLATRGAVLSVSLVILAVLVTGFALMTPSVQSLISRRTDPSRQGEVLGVNQSASALARILGPAIGPFLFVVERTHVLPYIVGAVLMGSVFLLTMRIREE
jgi:MFS family permease